MQQKNHITALHLATKVALRFPADIALRLQNAKWWDKDPIFVSQIMAMTPEKALQQLAKSGSGIAQYTPVTFILSNEGMR